MTAPIALLNCCRFDESAGAERTSVIVRDGLIESIGSTDIIPEDAVIIDAEGRLLTPGFIDLHIHGAGGADVLHGTRAALETMSRTLARAGTTSFIATTAPRPNEGHRHLHVAAACVGTDLGGAELLGLYVEGPFVNMEKRGGLHPGGVYSPSIAALDEILAITDGALRLMTVAPELPGNLEVVERLLARGVIASFGHSDATYRQTLAGVQAGIRHVTHLFNAMRPIHHREPGPILAVLEASGVTAELVCDGVHVDPAIIGWAYRQLGRERCVCVTDGMRTLGMPDGRYEFAGMEGESRDGTARYLDGTLIGTTIPLAKMTGRFQRFCKVDAKTAIEAATVAPARVLGLEHRKGSLRAGMDADLVLLDKDWEPWLTMVGGAVVFERSAASR